MIEERRVGAHRIVKEAEHVITVHFGPNPTEAEAIALIDAEVEMVAGKPLFSHLTLRCSSHPDVRDVAGFG